jgi:hypothetical protein
MKEDRKDGKNEYQPIKKKVMNDTPREMTYLDAAHKGPL